MSKRSRRGDLATRFCDYMGRWHPMARLGDRIGEWLLPRPALAGGARLAVPAWRGAFPSGQDAFSTVYMALGPMPPNHRGTAPTSPAEPNRDTVIEGDDRPGFWNWLFNWGDKHNQDKQAWDKSHTRHGCTDQKYRGMHGRPCKYEGGSDDKCPSGTMSGWYWSYDCPGVGKVYYVDCCGEKTTTDKVWCGWTQEANWCAVYGRAARQTPPVTKYVCTLSILDNNMRTTAIGGGFEVVGVDP